MTETNKDNGRRGLATFKGPNLFEIMEARAETVREIGARLASYRILPDEVEDALTDIIFDLYEIVDNLEAVETQLRGE